MAVNINTLITGSMEIGNSSSTPSEPTSNSNTRATYIDNWHEDWSGEIVGELTSESIPYIEDIESIEIGTSVTSIGDYAFWNGESLRTITLPDTITSVGEYVFSHLAVIEDITIYANGGNALNVK